MDKLKKRWGIQSNWQVFIILLVFACTGSSSAYLTEIFIDVFTLHRHHFEEAFFFGGLGHYTIKIIFMFLVYQILLVSFGWIFGQFTFFWNFEKKMLRRLGLGRYIKN